MRWAWMMVLAGCRPAPAEPLPGPDVVGTRPPPDAALVLEAPTDADLGERITCLSLHCDAGYAAAWFSSPSETVVGAGRFRDGYLVDGVIFELSGTRTSRIDVSEDLGMVHRDGYAIVLEMRTVGRGLRAPTGSGHVEWHARTKTPPPNADIRWAGGIIKIEGPPDLVEQTELDLTESVNGAISEVGGLVFLRRGSGAYVANVGSSGHFVRGNSADVTITRPDGSTGKLVVAGDVLIELPLPAPSPAKAWKADLAETTTRIRGDLQRIDAALSELTVGLQAGRDIDELRAVASSLQTPLLDAMHQSRDLSMRIPAKESERRIAGFLLPRALARLQPHIEAIAEVMAQAELTPTTTPILTRLVDRASPGYAFSFVATLAL